MSVRRRWANSRFSVAWHVLRGRPTMYRVRAKSLRFVNGQHRGVLMYECKLGGDS